MASDSTAGGAPADMPVDPDATLHAERGVKVVTLPLDEVPALVD